MGEAAEGRAEPVACGGQHLYTRNGRLQDGTSTAKHGGAALQRALFGQNEDGRCLTFYLPPLASAPNASEVPKVLVRSGHDSTRCDQATTHSTEPSLAGRVATVATVWPIEANSHDAA